MAKDDPNKTHNPKDHSLYAPLTVSADGSSLICAKCGIYIRPFDGATDAELLRVSPQRSVK